MVFESGQVHYDVQFFYFLRRFCFYGLEQNGSLVPNLWIWAEDNFVLSCDMPFVSKELIRYILSKKEGYQAVMPINNGFAEPLCAYYRKDIAKDAL